MASQAQIDANRRNAQKSTGPRTPEGKARSARNALKHGLASISPHAFLAVEDKLAFDRLLQGYILTYQPQHADEVDLLVDAAYCKWRQQRIWNVDTQLIEMAVAEHQHDLQRKLPKANTAAHIANGVVQCANQSQLNRRYEAQLHRQYLRNLKLLRELQAERADWESTLEDFDEPPLPSAPPVAPPSTQPSVQTPSIQTPIAQPSVQTPGTPAVPETKPPQAA
jgi:hypothetical protein